MKNQEKETGKFNLTKAAYTADEVKNLLSECEFMHKLENSKNYRFFQIGEMTANLVHDLKNPLNSFNMLAEGISWVIQDLEEAEVSREIIDRLKNIEILMTKQIVEYDKRLTGISALAKQSSYIKAMKVKELEKVINQLLSMFTTQFHKYETKMLIEINWESLSDKVILMNPAYLTQVLSAGLKNSLESLQRNGIKDRWIKLLIEERDSLAIVIQDSATPEIEQEKYFINGYSTKSEGLGLGLNVARNILKMFNASIYFNEQERRYTSLIVDIKYE